MPEYLNLLTVPELSKTNSSCEFSCTQLTLPSTIDSNREGSGDQWLREARGVARENEGLIGPSNLEIVKERDIL